MLEKRNAVKTTRELTLSSAGKKKKKQVNKRSEIRRNRKIEQYNHERQGCAKSEKKAATVVISQAPRGRAT